MRQQEEGGPGQKANPRVAQAATVSGRRASGLGAVAVPRHHGQESPQSKPGTAETMVQQARGWKGQQESAAKWWEWCGGGSGSHLG